MIITANHRAPFAFLIEHLGKPRGPDTAAGAEVDYKVVFSVAAVAHRHIAAVFHQGGGDAVLANDVYKARHNGTINPNIALLHELKQAGVELRVCGQGLLGKKVDPKAAA